MCSAAVLILLCFFFAGSAHAQDAPIKLKVIAEVANIRQNSDIGSPIIHQLPQGAFIEANRKQGEWYSVELRLDDEKVLSGFVHESLVMALAPPPPQKRKEERPEEKIPEKESVEEEPITKVPPFPVKKTVSQQAFRRFGFSLSGGLNYAGIGDLNDGVDGLAGYYGATLGDRAGGSADPLHWSKALGAELSYFISAGITVNLGLDYISGKKENLIEFPDRKFSEIFTAESSVKSTPISLSLTFYPYDFLRFRFGMEYHMARCEYFYRIEEEDRWQEWRGEASASGVGFIGGLGFERDIASYLSLFLEVSGRLCRIKNWEGKDTFTESTGSLSTESGDLYIYQGSVNKSESFPLVFISEKRPSEAGVSDVRLASLNFTGLVIKAGIKFKF